jgi:hypothetical protein
MNRIVFLLFAGRADYREMAARSSLEVISRK